MKILVDMVHMADVNFYKNAVNILRKQGHDISISVLDRGNLPEVVKKEYGKATIVGRHSKGSILKKSYYNLRRVLALKRFIKKIKPDVVTSFSYYPAAAVFDKNIRSVVFHDDAEYKKQFKLCQLFAEKFVIPDFIPIDSMNIKKYHSYKEWAYLNPLYFKPNPSVLKRYGLKENKYVFIRDIATVSLNYKNNSSVDYSQIIPILRKKGLKIVVSLEDKSQKSKFKGCVILQEPVKDFYSLIYYSLALISSGDTMPREAALLGVPSYYIGNRKMAVNKELIGHGLITLLNNSHVNKIKELSVKTKKSAVRKLNAYIKTLDDTTRVILGEVL